MDCNALCKLVDCIIMPWTRPISIQYGLFIPFSLSLSLERCGFDRFDRFVVAFMHRLIRLFFDHPFLSLRFCVFRPFLCVRKVHCLRFALRSGMFTIFALVYSGKRYAFNCQTNCLPHHKYTHLPF